MREVISRLAAVRAPQTNLANLASTRTLLAGICLAVCASASSRASAQQTTTVLSITSSGNPVSTAASGTVVTLTAIVSSGPTTVTKGTVNFCDASAARCTDSHLIGSAQITSAGAAIFRFTPAIGTHSYKAVFAGIASFASSSSTAADLSVTGKYPTITSLVTSGSNGSYGFTGYVTSGGVLAPSGSISFQDATDANATLGSATLTQNANPFVQIQEPSVAPTADAQFVALADVNGDGFLDAVILNYDTVNNINTLIVALGRGDGTFASALAPMTILGAYNLAVGDFNQDGKLDIVFATLSGTIDILSGNGDGTFQPAVVVASIYATQVAVADLNGDGNLDILALSGSGSVSILLGAGNNTFQVQNGPYLGTAFFSTLVVRDFNNDGFPDIAVLNNDATTLWLLLGDGTGNFTVASTTSLPIPLTYGSYPISIASGDFNGDGVPDLAVLVYYNMYVLLGDGSGSFGPPTTYSGLYAYAENGLSVGDFNGDGKLDLAASDAGHHALVMYLGNGDGTFDASSLSPLKVAPLAAGDLDGDGLPDLFIGAGYYSEGAIPYLSRKVYSTSSVSGLAPTTSGNNLVLASYPGDSNFAASVSGETSLNYPSAAAHITWLRPAPITYGTALSAAQLDAVASVPGSFMYSPAAGTVPHAGIQTLSATFTPANTAEYTTASATVPLVVNKAPTTVTWTAPAAITYGTALSAAQLDATSTVPGSFYYYPLAGTTLPLGTQTLSVTFIPTDSADYLSSTATVPLTVNQGATPEVSWTMPAPIAYGTALSAAQLDAVSSVPGSFAYSPAAGTVLKPGIYPLSASFTPTNTNSYALAMVQTLLVVSKAPTSITWLTPAPISAGTALSAAQLDATASVPGNFYYNAIPGELLPAGPNTLSVTFIPTDTADYLASTASVTLTVNGPVVAASRK